MPITPFPSFAFCENPAALFPQEALEFHNPQFISRSQKRQKRLQLMVQLRRAQQREAPPGTPRALPRKLSTSTASRKKQFTIPDPLSGELWAAAGSWLPWKSQLHLQFGQQHESCCPWMLSSISAGARGRNCQLRDGVRRFCAAGRELLGDFLSLSPAVVFFSKVQLLLLAGVMAINDISPPASSQNGDRGGIWDRSPSSRCGNPRALLCPALLNQGMQIVIS